MLETANKKKREREREETERKNWRPAKNKIYLSSFENIPQERGKQKFLNVEDSNDTENQK